MFMKYDLEKIVGKDHCLRKVSAVVCFGAIALGFVELFKEIGRKGYGVEVGIKALFLQFFYDLSDRQLYCQHRRINQAENDKKRNTN